MVNLIFWDFVVVVAHTLIIGKIYGLNNKFAICYLLFDKVNFILRIKILMFEKTFYLKN